MITLLSITGSVALIMGITALYEAGKMYESELLIIGVFLLITALGIVSFLTVTVLREDLEERGIMNPDSLGQIERKVKETGLEVLEDRIRKTRETLNSKKGDRNGKRN